MAGEFQITIDSRQLDARLQKLLTMRFDRALMQGGMLLETQIKANASGRPGPRTGSPPTYRGTWNTQLVSNRAQSAEVSVGTNSPYGPRLEYGFSGMTDSRDRFFPNWGPFPHVEDAFVAKQQDVVDMIETELIKALKS